MRKLKLIIPMVLLFASVSTAAAKGEGPYVTPVDCPIEVPAGVALECATLHVPENYEKPEGRWISMPFIRIHSEVEKSNQPPLLFTSGGPGGDSLRAVWWMPNTGFHHDRDVIIYQQRGNHLADPALTCELDEIYDQATGGSPCLETFQAAGIDLTQYHTSVIAEDIESLRVALEIDQWDFWGVSYSTRLAQVLMDRHPEGLRSVILQSVSLLNETRFQHDPEDSLRALRVMFSDCAADNACNAAYPDLEERFYALLKELNHSPVELSLSDPATGEEVPFQLTGDTLIGWMVSRAFYQHAYPPYDAAFFPLVIDALAEGNTNFLPDFAQHQLGSEVFTADYLAFGLYLAANCQDDAHSFTFEQIEEQIAAYPELDGYFRHMDEWQICQLWDLPPAPPLADAPLSSEVPTLVLAGRYDPITPPEGSKAVAEALTNSYYVEFPARGHDIDTGEDCGIQIKRSFLQDPWSAPDTRCIADDPPPTFILPDELVRMEGFLLSVEDINFGVPEQGNPTIEIFSGISLGIFSVEILLFLVFSVMIILNWSERQEKARRSGYVVHLLAALTAVLAIGSVFMLSEINQKHLWANGLLNSLGYFQSSPVVTGLGVVVLAQMVTVVFLVIMMIRIWRVRKLNLINRIFLTLVALAGIGFSVFYIRWDLVILLFNKPGL